MRGRCTETGDADAAAHHADVGSRALREDRHDPFLERNHILGQTADVRLLIDRCAIREIRDRDSYNFV